jgi:NADH:ubiquinone oxidoreductase subunit 2 (subunit N)
LVTSLISTYYYLRIIKIMWFDKKAKWSRGSILLNIGSNNFVVFVCESFLWGFIIFSGYIIAYFNVLVTFF